MHVIALTAGVAARRGVLGPYLQFALGAPVDVSLENRCSLPVGVEFGALAAADESTNDHALLAPGASATRHYVATAPGAFLYAMPLSSGLRGAWQNEADPRSTLVG